MKTNTVVRSNKTGKTGIVQATWKSGKFMMFTGTNYEHFDSSSEVEIETDEKKIARLRRYRISGR